MLRIFNMFTKLGKNANVWHVLGAREIEKRNSLRLSGDFSCWEGIMVILKLNTLSGVKKAGPVMFYSISVCREGSHTANSDLERVVRWKRVIPAILHVSVSGEGSHTAIALPSFTLSRERGLFPAICMLLRYVRWGKWTCDLIFRYNCRVRQLSYGNWFIKSVKIYKLQTIIQNKYNMSRKINTVKRKVDFLQVEPETNYLGWSEIEINFLYYAYENNFLYLNRWRRQLSILIMPKKCSKKNLTLELSFEKLLAIFFQIFLFGWSEF